MKPVDVDKIVCCIIANNRVPLILDKKLILRDKFSNLTFSIVKSTRILLSSVINRTYCFLVTIVRLIKMDAKVKEISAVCPTSAV